MPRKQPGSQQYHDYRHTAARRKNNPPAGIAPTYSEVRERETRQYAYDPHLDPQLVWAGKAEPISFEIEVVLIPIHPEVCSHAQT